MMAFIRLSMTLPVEFRSDLFLGQHCQKQRFVTQGTTIFLFPIQNLAGCSMKRATAARRIGKCFRPVGPAQTETNSSRRSMKPPRCFLKLVIRLFLWLRRKKSAWEHSKTMEQSTASKAIPDWFWTMTFWIRNWEKSAHMESICSITTQDSSIWGPITIRVVLPPKAFCAGGILLGMPRFRRLEDCTSAVTGEEVTGGMGGCGNSI